MCSIIITCTIIIYNKMEFLFRLSNNPCRRAESSALEGNPRPLAEILPRRAESLSKVIHHANSYGAVTRGG